MLRLPTIFGKGILVVSIPLFTQAIFVGMLIRSASENADAQRWAVHTKEVITKIEETYRWLLESYAGVRDLIVLEHPRSSESVEGDLVRCRRHRPAQRVRRRQSPSAGTRRRSRRPEPRIPGSLELDGAPGQRRAARQAAGRLDETAAALSALRSKIDVILAEESRLDQDARRRSVRTNWWHFWILAAGGVATVALTLGLSVLFFKQIVKRLEVLRENTRRLAEGKGLALPLSGEDELAQVDRAFHEMAASLGVQKQENEMFVYSVSHDLRSPLINLQGFSHELKHSSRDLETLFDCEGLPSSVVEKGRKLLQENIAESIHYIQAAVDRLSRIIDSLLRLSRAGRVHYQWQTVDIASVVGRVVDALHDSIREKHAEVVVNTLPEACGDPTAVEQIFANLLSNAVKYLDPARPGRIEVGDGASSSSEIPSGLQLYYVKDNGLGIPEAYHAACLHGVQSLARRRRRRAKESAWPWYAEWSSATAARSGLSQLPAWEPRFSSPCRAQSPDACQNRSFPRPPPLSERHDLGELAK